ncbi:uncharacterized protein V6R79_021643 [Siganus canaliculatus]
MASKVALFWCCLLVAVHHLSAAADEALPPSCDVQHIALGLQGAVECGENLPWTHEQAAALLVSMKNLTDNLHKHQMKACQGAEPKQCPDPEIPRNGGLVCATAAGKRFCKPLCNNGFDFHFLRRSHPYNECSEQRGYRWDTYNIGSNSLAYCRDAVVQISGADSAYFPKGQDCLAHKSDNQLQAAVIRNFTTELKNAGVKEEIRDACLVCGGP